MSLVKTLLALKQSNPYPTPVPKKKLDPRVLKALQELGRIGGQTRAKRLTPEQRREIARKASLARWRKKKA